MRTIIAACIALAFVSTADATPGALNSKGCHKGHCHGFSGAQKFKNGRYFMPGHFTHKSKRKHK